MINVEKYIDILRDPADKGILEIQFENDKTIGLKGKTSGIFYPFCGDFPDLRPKISGKNCAIPGFDDITRNKHARVKSHYENEPCNNYLCLDNVPLGRYLRDSEYAHFFNNVNLLVEVGSGKGAIAKAVKQYRGITPFCIDLAYGSLRYIRKEPLHADGVLGSNLALPLADGVADMVFSYGVIHHTPNPILCFSELARILKPGGLLLLNVYNWENLYRSLYFFFSPPFKYIRNKAGHRLGNIILQASVFLPYTIALWFVIGLVQKKWTIPNLHTGWEQFSDFFLTPIAKFYHIGELLTLGSLNGLEVIQHETGGWPQNSFSHFIWFRKK